jgi:hypothetical protein
VVVVLTSYGDDDEKRYASLRSADNEKESILGSYEKRERDVLVRLFFS